MRLKHFIIEGFCDHDSVSPSSPPFSELPCAASCGEMGFYCLNCPSFSYAPAPFELAFSNQDGIVEHSGDWISPSFSSASSDEYVDEPELSSYKELWASICRRKILEAYSAFQADSDLT